LYFSSGFIRATCQSPKRINFFFFHPSSLSFLSSSPAHKKKGKRKKKNHRKRKRLANYTEKKKKNSADPLEQHPNHVRGHCIATQHSFKKKPVGLNKKEKQDALSLLRHIGYLFI